MIMELVKHCLIIGIIITLAFSCNKKSPLIPFYQQLENEIGNQEILDRYRHLTKDSLDIMYQSFKKEYQNVFEISENKNAINTYLDSENINKTENYRWHIILFGFQKYLNNQPIDLEELIWDYGEAIKIAKDRHDAQQKLYDQKYYQIVRRADSRWNPGDTINFILPVNIDTDSSRYTYYNIGYPYSLDYSSADDSISMKGVLLKKFYDDGRIDTNESETDSVHLVFKLKIIELSDTITKVDWEKLKIGDEFDLWLKLYGRPIE